MKALKIVMNDLYFNQLCVDKPKANSIHKSIDLCNLSVYSQNVFEFAKKISPEFEKLNQESVIVWEQHYTREGGLLLTPNSGDVFTIQNAETGAKAEVDNRILGLYCSLAASDITSQHFKNKDSALFLAFMKNTVALGIGCCDLSDLYHFVDIPTEESCQHKSHDFDRSHTSEYDNDYDEQFDIDLENSINALTDGKRIFSQIQSASKEQIKQSRNIGVNVQLFI